MIGPSNVGRTKALPWLLPAPFYPNNQNIKKFMTFSAT